MSRPRLQHLDAWWAVLNWKATVMIGRGEVKDGLLPDPPLQNAAWSILLRVWLQPLCACVFVLNVSGKCGLTRGVFCLLASHEFFFGLFFFFF